MKKFLSKWIIPQGFVELIRSRNNSKFDNFKLPETEKNIELKNTHTGKRCFILATGPSVKNQDLAWLNDELTISVGSFFLHEDIKKINPKYHIFAPAHSPFEDDAIKIIFEGFKKAFEEVTEPEVIMGVSSYKYSYFNFLKANSNLLPIKPYYVNFDCAEQLDEQNYLSENIWDLTKKPFAIRTVVYLAIQFAVYAGCTEIYLLGCDHDYLQDTARTTNHFYNDSKSYSDKAHLESFSTEKWFEEYYMRWKQYRLIKTYCESKSIKVYNATKGGMLDVFERVDLDSLSNGK